MNEKFPSVGTHSTWVSAGDRLVAKPGRQVPYSQCTREGSVAYPAPHKYRDIPAESQK